MPTAWLDKACCEFDYTNNIWLHSLLRSNTAYNNLQEKNLQKKNLKQHYQCQQKINIINVSYVYVSGFFVICLINFQLTVHYAKPTKEQSVSRTISRVGKYNPSKVETKARNNKKNITKHKPITTHKVLVCRLQPTKRQGSCLPTLYIVSIVYLFPFNKNLQLST